MEPEELKVLIEEQVKDIITSALQDSVAALVEAGKPKTEALEAGLNELREARRRAQQDALIDAKLNATKLSEVGKKRTRAQLVEASGRRDLSEAEIDATVNETVAYEAALVQQFSNPHSVIKMGEVPHERYLKALQGWFKGEDVDNTPRFRDLREAYARWTGTDYLDVNPIEMFYGFGAKYDSAITHKRIRESLTTSSWGEIFADNLYVMLVKEYRESALYNNWQKVVSDIEDVPDFQTRHWVRVGGYADLSTVAEQGTYTSFTSPTDEEVAYTLSKRGGLDDVTIEMLSYDRGAAKVRRIPSSMARAAKRTLYKFVMNLITTDNPTMDYDSVALYHADHSNTGTTALTLAGLNTTQAAMRDQTAYSESNEILGERNMIKYLIVPNEIEMRARRIVDPSGNYSYGLDYPTGTGNIRPDQDQSIDPLAFKGRGIEVLVYDQLTDANDWFAVADPREVPTVVLGFWNGQRDPELYVQDNPTTGSVFTSDKITYKVRHVYGGDVIDHRSFYRQVVA